MFGVTAMKYFLLLTCVLTISTAAWSQPTTAYYGVALGSFDYQEEDFGGTTLFTDTTDSYRLMVGYQFSEHLSFEGGWGKTGTLRDSAIFDTFAGPLSVDFQSEFTILTVRLLGVLPFDSGITLLGGLGYADMEQKYTYDVLGEGPRSSEVSGGEPTYFAAVQYDWERFAMRLAYEKYDDFDSIVEITETSLGFFYKL
jgi:hypothetical protein